MNEATPNATDAVERVRGCLSDGVTPSLASVQALLRDRDRLHAVYRAACAAVALDVGRPDGSDRQQAVFDLAALIGAYEGGRLS